MIKFALIALATAGLTTAAMAQEDNINVNVNAASNMQTASVNIADLNLTTVTGQALLRDRLRVAVRDVCTFDNGNTLDTPCVYDAQHAASVQATALIAAAGAGHLAQNSVVLHAAR